jgi:hypothetical protein
MTSKPIDSQTKKLQEAIQQYFHVVPMNRRGENRFKGGFFRKSTRSASEKPNLKPQRNSDPIQVSSDIEIPHKIIREVSVEYLEPDREIKSEPIPSHKPCITPTSQMPTLVSKDDRPYTSIKGSKPSYETFDHTPVIEKLQQENVQLLQQLEEEEPMARHLHHENAVLQEKVNSLQRLVDQMTNDNRSLREKLKHHKRHKIKSSGREGETSKDNLPPPLQV